MSKLEKKLNTINACVDAVEWSKSQKSSFQDAWDNCKRGDWLLWLLGRSKSDHKKIVLASCKIARTVLKYVPKGEKRPLKSIQTAEAWVRGEATLEEVKKAAFAASAASSASSAASAAAHAADAADAAAAYAAFANAAASYAAFAAANAANAASRKKYLLNSANIVREFFPKPPRF